MHFTTKSALAVGTVLAAASVQARDSYRFNGMAGDIARRGYSDEGAAQQLWAREVVGMAETSTTKVNGQTVAQSHKQSGINPMRAPATPSTPTTPQTPATPATPATPSTPTTPSTPASSATPAKISKSLMVVLSKVASESKQKSSWEHAICYQNGQAARFLFHDGQLAHHQTMPQAKLRKGPKNPKGLSVATSKHAAVGGQSRHAQGHPPSSAGSVAPHSAMASPMSAPPQRSAAPMSPGTPASPQTPQTPATPQTPTTPSTPQTPQSAAHHGHMKGAAKGKKGRKGKKARPTCITWTLDDQTASLMAQHFGGANSSTASAATSQAKRPGVADPAAAHPPQQQQRLAQTTRPRQ